MARTIKIAPISKDWKQFVMIRPVGSHFGNKEEEALPELPWYVKNVKENPKPLDSL